MTQHEILTEVDNEVKALLKDRAIKAVKQIRAHVEMREVWIRNRQHQKQKLEELQHEILHAYDTADTKLMDKCGTEFQKIIARKASDDTEE